MDELNKSHVSDVEHDIETSFDKVITLPIHTDGRDSGVAIYVGLTNIGRYAIGPVSDQRILGIAGRVGLDKENTNLARRLAMALDMLLDPAGCNDLPKVRQIRAEARAAGL